MLFFLLCTLVPGFRLRGSILNNDGKTRPWQTQRRRRSPADRPSMLRCVHCDSPNHQWALQMLCLSTALGDTSWTRKEGSLCFFLAIIKCVLTLISPTPPPTRMTLPLADTRKCDIQGNVNCVQSQTDSEFPYVKTAPHIKCYYPM